MDRKTRRSSILKVRKEFNEIEETVVTDVPEASTRGRRVSFQNVKHIKQYEKDNGKLLIDGSPLRERITDTLDSDGILTPRGRCPDGSSIQVPPHNGSMAMDMSVDNQTLPRTVFYEKTVTTTVTERLIEQPTADYTMALFNMTSDETKDMSIANESVVFAAPRLPVRNVTMNESVMMELDESTKMDVSVNDTLAMFQSPARKVIREIRTDDPMDVTGMDSTVPAQAPEANVDMDISEVATPRRCRANDTLSIFQSPAPRANQTSMVLETPQKVFEENNEMEVPKPAIGDTSAMVQSSAKKISPEVRTDDSMDVTGVDFTVPVSAPEANVDMDISEVATPRRCRPNDTLSIFQSPAPRATQTSMVLETPQKVFEEHNEKEVSEAAAPETNVDMDISEAPTPKKPKANDTFPTENPTPRVEQTTPKVFEESSEMDISKRTINDTLAMFQSPARTQIKESMDLNGLDSAGPPPAPESNADMDISEIPTPVRLRTNDTLSIFQSPAQRVNQTSMVLDTTQKVFEEHTEMDISKPAVQSPVRTKLDDSIASAKMNVETPERSPEKVTYDDRTLVEEERAVMHSSVMDLDDLNETVGHLHQKSLNCSRLSEVDSTTDRTETVTEKSSPQKTMQIDTDATTTIQEVQSTSPEKTMRDDLTTQETSECSLVQVETSVAEHSIRSHVSRRRSLLRDSVRESPRRVALENSMITMNRDMTALVEHRRRKSLNTSTASVLNETANSTLGRDIYAMNMSVRSPLHTSQTTPQSPGFQMPNFDPAVFNVVWLTPEEGQTTPSAESLEFARLISEEKSRMEEEIRKSLLDGKLSAEKAEAVRSNKWESLTRDEKQVVLIARQQAELRFLELRIKFASEHRQKFEQQAREMEAENARLAEQLKDLENMDAIRKEIEELRSRPTRAECERIEAEWEEAQKWKFEMQMAAVKNYRKVMADIALCRKALHMAMEESEERLARQKEKEEKKNSELWHEVQSVMQSLEDAN